jgi:hypothetical protein
MRLRRGYQTIANFGEPIVALWVADDGAVLVRLKSGRVVRVHG